MHNLEGFGKPVIREIEKIVEENETIKTFYVQSEGIIPKPGQFYMIWLPEVDEKPISACIVDLKENLIGLTIKKLGRFTDEIHQSQKGRKIGIRGPFGRGFEYENESKRKTILIAGGIGIAPIRALFDHLKEKGEEIVLIYGAQTKEELIFRGHFSSNCEEVSYCTDDGSYGHHGFPTEILKDCLVYDKNVIGDEKEKMNDYTIYGCGPEKFLKAVLALVKDYDEGMLENTQLSLADRYMRCGVGFCGSCVLDETGLSVCKDGPVFKGTILEKTTDFGRYGRNSDGSKDKL